MGTGNLQKNVVAAPASLWRSWQIAVPAMVDRIFTYKADAAQTFAAGDMVRVPFAGRTLFGVVMGEDNSGTLPLERQKEIAARLPLAPLDAVTLDFLRWVADYTLAPLGAVMKMVLPPREMFAAPKRARKNSTDLLFDMPHCGAATLDFNAAQKKAITFLNQQVAAQTFSVTLLDGVTGAGKTDVYFEAIADTLKQDPQAQVAVLLPEIAMSGQWLARFQERFGVAPAVWHSELTPRVRAATWRAVQAGTARVVVGARSALFLPYMDLRLLVIDEEHDMSFKQEEGVPYHARDMAVKRAHLGNLPVILSSATPALETLYNVERGRYHHVELPARAVARAALPSVHLVDLRTEKMMPQTWLSPTLREQMSAALARGEQTLLFLNRRGYAPLMLCKACGHRMGCQRCTAWMVEHKTHGKMLCHACGHAARVPEACPSCAAEKTLTPWGPGVERVAEEAAATFANARVLTLSSDTLTTPKKIGEALEKINRREVDILVGTQVMAKGHHFAHLTLVGVIDADAGLAGSDLRACERTFQLLQQVGGRAGREEIAGHVYIQTYMPDHPVICALQKNDRALFLNEEKRVRDFMRMPPYGRLAALIVSAPNEAAGLSFAQRVARTVPALPPEWADTVQVLGPAPAPMARVRRRWRFRLLVKVPRTFPLQNFLRDWLTQCPPSAGVRLHVDIDPYSFY